MTTREAFERGTETFNAHDIKAFADVLGDDVVFAAPGGMRGEGKAACVAFYGSWFDAFPDAHVEVHSPTPTVNPPSTRTRSRRVGSQGF
jgi:hypothetical protein